MSEYEENKPSDLSDEIKNFVEDESRAPLMGRVVTQEMQEELNRRFIDLLAERVTTKAACASQCPLFQNK